MSLPHAFLDEIRSRLTLSSVVGRRIKLTRSGREFKACCPFHNEKTPSFWVNDDKGFFHCFGCGAHGDVIGFEMRAGSLGFREAVEKLAGEAGLEIPRDSPEDAIAEARRASTLDVIEAACVFFEGQLKLAGGDSARAYLKRRGVDQASIARFRLGWAPGGMILKGALARQNIQEEQLVEAGLLKRRDDGSVGEYFRDRLIFPITDRRGRVIAFGGRTLTDAQPKYLNSPDSDIFHKGQTLYGLSLAREPAGKAREIIVAEGYMDVIALAMAGFPQAVAPLGTAVTEGHLTELWKLADEPIICLDGDKAGIRAAARAADRALPLLTPGKSLRFAVIPGGQDPDEYIRDRGPAAMRTVLDGASSLLDLLWQQHTEGKPIDTPERRAGLEADLTAMTGRITDRAVQAHYRQAVKDRLWTRFRPPKAVAPAFRPATGGRNDRFKRAAPEWSAPLVRPPGRHNVAEWHRRILLACLITHPALFDSVAERLGSLDYPDLALDRLRAATLMVLSSDSNLDFDAVKGHLHSVGFGSELDSLLSSGVFAHASFCKPESDLPAAQRGWEQVYSLARQPELEADVIRAVDRLGRDATPEAFDTLVALTTQGRLAEED